MAVRTSGSAVLAASALFATAGCPFFAPGPEDDSPAPGPPVCEGRTLATDVVVEPGSASVCEPGVCLFVGGSIIVADSRPVDLSDLSCIFEVDGDVRISSPSLASLAGLGNLERVGGDLDLSSSLIRDTTALSALESVGGTIGLGRLDLLESIQLPALAAAGALYVGYNPVLTRIELGPVARLRGLLIHNLPALREFGGRLALGTLDDLEIRETPLLAAVSSLGLESADRVYVAGTGLQDLAILDGLASVGELEVASNAEMRSARGLGELRTVGGSIQFYYNPLLDPFDDLTSLEEVEGALLVDDELPTAHGPEALRRVGGSLLVRTRGGISGFEGLEEAGNLLLTANGTVDGFGALRWVNDFRVGASEPDEELDVRGFPVLEEVGSLSLREARSPVSTGLPLLRGVLGSVRLTRVGSTAGLEGLRTIGGVLNVQGFDADGDLSGLPGLVELGGLSLRVNDDLTSLGTLGVPAELPLGVELHDNAHLTDIGALTSLRRTSFLRITENNFLPSVQALYQLESIGAELRVWDNPWLPDADVEGLIEAVGEANIQGPIVIGNNGG